MTNLARQWLKDKGFEWREITDAQRFENIARVLAEKESRRERAEMMERLRKRFSRERADSIIERGRQIYNGRRRRIAA